MNALIRWFVGITKPLVWRVASAYDIPIHKPFFPYGAHRVTLEDGLPLAKERIPRSTYFNTASGSIFVGSNTIFGENVMLLTGKHLNAEEALAAGAAHHAVPPLGRDIVIGRHCYVGSGAILIGPLVVGDFAVIGAGAVVSRNVPARAKVVGNPASVIGQVAIPTDG